MTRRDFIKGGIMTAGILASSGINQAIGAEQPLFPPHAPLGKGKGVYPGRVVWVHDPKSVTWEGNGYWWQPENFNYPVILAMTRKGLMRLTGADNPAEAWNALFEWRNAENGKKGAYASGQKIAIKPNMNGAGEYDDDATGHTAESYGNAVLLSALLYSLVKDAGVNPKDITIFDTCRIFPNYMIKLCASSELAGINFRHRNPGGSMDAAADENSPIEWAGQISGLPTFLPKCLTEAAYLINLANLKGHSWGMTLGAKNHFGTFVNKDRLRTPQAAGLHSNIINNQMGDYSALTDLIALPQIRDKTVLCVLDGLITTPGEIMGITSANSTWKQTPFNGYYACSLFFSQDPIAIDSVGADFLANEPVMREYNSNFRNNHGMENYLHEAALIEDPPSGSKYASQKGSLGVHEHWNNPKEKLYSRNRGAAEGIELVRD